MARELPVDTFQILLSKYSDVVTFLTPLLLTDLVRLAYSEAHWEQ